MKKIIFRCDAGKVKELGTGHLIRSLCLAKMLIKSRNIKKKDILFLIKTKKNTQFQKKLFKEKTFHTNQSIIQLETLQIKRQK